MEVLRRTGWMITLCGALAMSTSPLQGQGLRDLISQLFIFGSSGDPLFLAGTADASNPISVQAHSAHFVPSAESNNASLISFLTNSVSSSIANIPFSATSSGHTFRFEGGVPVATSTSPGPIVAERANTLGRGRLLVGGNVTVIKFKTVRGVDLNDLRLNFVHVNADFDGCDAAFGGDCTQRGLPLLENDVIELTLDMDLSVRATTVFMTYGLLDNVDIGVVVPIVTTNLRASSEAQVRPFGGPTASHFFAGTPDIPNLFATRQVDGSATGIGDVATRLKIGLNQSNAVKFSLMADARFATGSAADLLGAGEFAIRGLGIFSGQFGDFGAHGNVGYLYRDSDVQNDAILATLGFDEVLAPWATFVVDLVSELQVGENTLVVPEPVVLENPFRRVIRPSFIPDMRDDIVNAAVGMKFVTNNGPTMIVNSMWPLNRGGLRSDLLWTVGLEYNF